MQGCLHTGSVKSLQTTGVTIKIAAVKKCYDGRIWSGMVNSKSFVGKDFLQIKWKFELSYRSTL